MLITHFELIVTEITQKAKIISIADVERGQWECLPHYILGQNDVEENILNIEFEIIRKKGNKQLTMKTMTSFRLTLAKREYKPTTDADFELYTLFSQIALSHTRIFFLYEAKGTSFQGDLLNADSNKSQMNKMKLALGIN